MKIILVIVSTVASVNSENCVYDTSHAPSCANAPTCPNPLENNFIGEGEETGTERSESVKSRSESKTLTDREKELLEKMLHNLKKFGCAFCKER